MPIHLELHFIFSVNFIINFQLTLQTEMVISGLQVPNEF